MKFRDLLGFTVAVAIIGVILVRDLPGPLDVFGGLVAGCLIVAILAGAAADG